MANAHRIHISYSHHYGKVDKDTNGMFMFTFFAVLASVAFMAVILAQVSESADNDYTSPDFVTASSSSAQSNSNAR